MTTYTIKLARTITSGDISTKNSKMRGTSFGLNASQCITGSKLRKIPGSVCATCYCCDRGTDLYPTVKQGRTNNTQAVINAKEDNFKQWVAAMVFLLLKRCKFGYHRPFCRCVLRICLCIPGICRGKLF